MTYAAQALIDLNALRQNLQLVRKEAPNSKVLAVIKANGYGHDIVRVARALEQADCFAVACIEEALLLRDSAVDKPILLLQGVAELDEINIVRDQGFQLVIHHESQIDMLEQADKGARVTVWMKIDTGMHRLGFQGDDIRKAWQRLKKLDGVKEIILMSHLAESDRTRSQRTIEQIAEFEAATVGMKADRSLANSGGLLGWSQSHYEWVRPGIMLYGISPFEATTGEIHGLKPVMTLSSRLIAVKHISKGEYVGYGSDWTAPRDMLIGVASIGYGDGYPRHAKPGTPVLVNGQRVPLIGRVSMDMICVDLNNLAGARPGDPVVAWGRGLPVEEIAQYADTIPYEVVCKVTRRVKRLVVELQ